MYKANFTLYTFGALGKFTLRAYRYASMLALCAKAH
jgi:hypothetical protein